MSGADVMARLKEVLGVLRKIQRDAATGALSPTGSPGGRLVFSSGRLTAAILGGGVAASADARSVAREILRTSVTSGGVTFEAGGGTLGPAEGSSLLNAGDLILDLANAMADPEAVRAIVGAPDVLLAPAASPPDLLPRLALTPSEGFLLSRVDGPVRLEEILAVSPLAEDETLRALFGLLAAGLLGAPGCEPFPPEPAAARSAPPAGKPSPAAPRASALDDFLKRTAGPSAAPPATPAHTAPTPPAPRAEPPSSAATHAVFPSKEDKRASVEKRIADCRNADHYAILGVERTANEGAVRHAYYMLARTFHPDRYRGPEFEKIFLEIERMFAATTEAYSTLTDEALRAEYDRQLAEEAGGIRSPEVDHAAQAREAYLRGRKHLEAEEYFDALRLLETASTMDPSKPDHWLYLGIVQTKNPRWRKKAEESFLKVIEMNPSHMQAYLHLARLYKSGGLQRRAAEFFEKVLEWEPENKEALEAVGRKKPEQPGASRGLRSLFKGPKS